MANTHDPAHDEHRKAEQAAHRVEHPAAPDSGALAALTGRGDAGALLGNPQLSGRGNGPVRAAVLQRMQQTYGNRAVQRFLQRQASSAAVSVQRDDPAATATVPAAPPTSTPATGTAPPTSTPATGGETPAPAGDATLSGGAWVEQFPGSRSLSDLDSEFGAKVQQFIDALNAAGVTPKINATKRPKERAYLMHWAWEIVKANYDAQTVPAYAGGGVNINWWHGDAESSKAAAQEMVSGYSINNLKTAPALTSRHISGKAVDMEISWSGDLKIKQADGTEVTITSSPRDSTNADLIAVAATYGVVHFTTVAKDTVHWSTDGR